MKTIKVIFKPDLLEHLKKIWGDDNTKWVFLKDPACSSNIQRGEVYSKVFDVPYFIVDAGDYDDPNVKQIRIENRDIIYGCILLKEHIIPYHDPIALDDSLFD